MGKEKGGFLSPKAIANRIKSKGLQKLRWYCQMCEKQCRDENGFKCHLTSESHQRQLLLFAENPDKYIDTFSDDFCSGYLELLSRRFGTKRVQANIVYQEYISDKEHIHMNSTQWETLTDFVKWVGKEGKCVVDQTEKGWYITYIDRDPATIARMDAKEKKERMELDDEEKTARMIQKQIEKAQAEGKVIPVHEATELKRENEEEKVVLSLSMSSKKKTEPTTSKIENPFSKTKPETDPTGGKDKSSEAEGAAASSSSGHKRKASALDDIIKMEEHKKEKINRKDYWLHEGIVVKIVTKKLGSQFNKKKAVVREVMDRYAAVIKVLDTGDKLKIDQAHVETVIPAIGKIVLIVNGAYRGMEAMLDALNEKRFSCTVTITKGLMKGRVVSDLPYEDVSKLQQ